MQWREFMQFFIASSIFVINIIYARVLASTELRADFAVGIGLSSHMTR